MIKELLPPSLAKDKNIQALTQALDKELEKIENQIINVLILPRIDQIQDEELLDLLAWQFHIEGYELAKNIEEKRNLIKRAIELHRYKGTKYAIKEVLRALGLEGEVKEWFEYGGKPYHFRVNIFAKNKLVEPEREKKLLKLIEEYKNVRSKLEKVSIGYSLGVMPIHTYAGFVDTSKEVFEITPIKENFSMRIHTYACFVDSGKEVFSNV